MGQKPNPTWNNFDSELENELRQERNEAQDSVFAARQMITRLRRRIASQDRYIEALESQLEPTVINEIRDELSQEADGDA